MASSLTFGKKLGAGFAAVVLLSLAMLIVAVVALRSAIESKDQVIAVETQYLIDAEVLRAMMHKRLAAVRGFLMSGDQSLLQDIRDSRNETDEAIDRIGQRNDPAARRHLVAIQSGEAEYRREADEVIARRLAGADDRAVLVQLGQRLTPKFDGLADNVRTFVADAKSQLAQSRQDSSEAALRSQIVLIAIGGGVLLVSALVAILLTRSLGSSVGGSVMHIRSSSAELQAAASQQASSAKEQATAMNEINTTIGELLVTARQIAESAQRVAKISADAAGGARAGDQQVRNAQDAVSSIRKQVDLIVQHMLDLGKKSQQIGGILEIINELAEQTNILAINATIEASGAGEAGRRFSVVGDEIRKLADRVGGSTKEIRALIEEIRAAVNTTVMATETGAKTVEAGSHRFSELAAGFQRIGDLVETTTEAAREIELSTKQQTTAVEQVNIAISNVAQTTKETEAGASQTLQTASQLASLSDELARLIRTQVAAG
jgi:methyl-accepting chemotaxis protein